MTSETLYTPPPGSRQSSSQPRRLIPIFVDQPDVTPRQRRRIAIVCSGIGLALIVMALAGLAFEDHGPINLGLARWLVVLDGYGLPFTWFVAAAECGIAAIYWFAMAAMMLFGATEGPKCGPNERINFHHRALRRQYAPALMVGVILLLVGVSVGITRHPLAQLFAGGLEMGAFAILGRHVWLVAVPESRLALTVITDLAHGLGNRVVLSGGMFNRSSRIIIRHEHIEEFAPCDGFVGRLLQYRDVAIRFRDHSGRGSTLIMKGAAADPIAAEISGYIAGDFKRALTPQVFSFPAQMRRGVEHLC